MSPETRPCQKEITSSKHHFSGDMLVFRGGINHCQRKILHWIVMSGKICLSLSIHHTVTRINFDRVAKALAVLLGYPGHGNKKSIVDIGTRGIILGGDRIKRKGKRGKQHGETTLERSSLMDFGLGAHGDGNLGMVLVEVKHPTWIFQVKQPHQTTKRRVWHNGQQIWIPYLPRLNRLNIFLIGVMFQPKGGRIAMIACETRFFTCLKSLKTCTPSISLVRLCAFLAIGCCSNTWDTTCIYVYKYINSSNYNLIQIWYHYIF